MSGSGDQAGGATAQSWQATAVNLAVQATGGQWGPPQATYWWLIRKRMQSRLIALPGAIALTALLCGVPLTLLSGAAQGALVVGVIGLAALGVAYLMYRVTAPRKRTGVVLFPHGFVYVDLDAASDQVTVWPFAEIADVRRLVVEHRYTHGTLKYTSHLYTVIHANGRQVQLNDHFVKVGELGDRVMNAVTALMLPQARERVHRGETLRFGPYEVSLHGIRLDAGMEVTPWREVSGVDMRNGMLEIRVGGRRLSIEQLHQIPNVLVLVSLAQELRQVSAGR